MHARKKLIGATVALTDCAPPDVEGLIAFLNGNFADLLGPVRSPREQDRDVQGRHLLEFDDGIIALKCGGGPIPWAELDVPCRTAWWWPEAEAALRPHRGRIELALLGARLEPVHAASVMTAFAAGVAAMADAAGVRWNDGLVVHSPEHFVGSALKMSSGELPVDCWIHVPLSVRDGKTTVMTTGMADLGLPEIEAVDVEFAPSLVVGRVTSFVAYLLQNGPVVKDGHAIGYSDQERIEVSRRPSSLRPGIDIFRLDFKKLLIPV